MSAVVDWYGPSDFGSFPPESTIAGLPRPEDLLVAGADDAMRAAVSPTAHVGPAAPPFLLVHGTADGVVPFAQSALLHERLVAAGADAELVPVEGADHIFLGAPDVGAIVARSVAFLAARLSSA